MTATAYPLAWPAGWPRTPPAERSAGQAFSQGAGTDRRAITLDIARKKLFDELEMLGATDVVLSANIPLRADGLPRSGATWGREPGIALYFTMNGQQLAMARDAYDNPAANVRSLGIAIAGMRALERHGGAAMVQRAFSGFSALPRPKSCWEILGIPPRSDATAIRSAWVKLAARHQADGGPGGMLGVVNAARDNAIHEIQVLGD